MINRHLEQVKMKVRVENVERTLASFTTTTTITHKKMCMYNVQVVRSSCKYEVLVIVSVRYEVLQHENFSYQQSLNEMNN